MDKIDVSITPSLAIEYMYCPRFIYFMKVLNIPQNEENRYKVIKGREVHEYKSLTNKDYLRKKIGVINKNINEELYSLKYRINGKLDEVLFLDDGTAAPLDYKFAVFNDKVYKTYRMQATMYALLIKENYDIEVNKAFLVYTRSKNYIQEIEIREKDYDYAKKIVNDILKIIQMNYFPKKTSAKSKCDDCCYRNVCVK